MINWYDIQPTFTEDGDTIVVGRPAFVASFHREPGLASQAADILDAWLALLPSGTVLWYSHEKTRQYLKLTPKALSKIRADFSPESLGQKFASYFIKSAPEGGRIDECDRYSFEMYAVDGHSGYAFVTFPLDHVEAQGADEVVRWFGHWCERFAFTHAGAGYGYEQAWFDEQEQFVGPTMLAVALRYHGVHAWVRSTVRFRDLGKTTLDTVAWLTFLDAESIADIGAGSVAGIDSRVTQYPIGSGVLLRAGRVRLEPARCCLGDAEVGQRRHRSDPHDAVVPELLGNARRSGEGGWLVQQDGRMNIGGWPFPISLARRAVDREARRQSRRSAGRQGHAGGQTGRGGSK